MARSFTDAARTALVERFEGEPAILLDGDALTEAAHALQSGDLQRLMFLFAVAA